MEFCSGIGWISTTTYSEPEPADPPVPPIRQRPSRTARPPTCKPIRFGGAWTSRNRPRHVINTRLVRRPPAARSVSSALPQCAAWCAARGHARGCLSSAEDSAWEILSECSMDSWIDCAGSVPSSPLLAAPQSPDTDPAAPLTAPRLLALPTECQSQKHRCSSTEFQHLASGESGAAVGEQEAAPMMEPKKRCSARQQDLDTLAECGFGDLALCEDILGACGGNLKACVKALMAMERG